MRSKRASVFTRLASAIKGFQFPGRAFLGIFNYTSLPGERDYSRIVGDGGGNSIVAACVNWIARTFPEAPPAMWDVDNDGMLNRIPKHPLVSLLRRPTASPSNPGGYYAGTLLWMATLVSWVLDGNAYWLKVRSRAGRVVQLWYVPHWLMEPRWPADGSSYISHYDYMVNGKVTPVPPSEVVHFRHGLDPNNTRKGKSPLASLLREVFTDDEAARFTASLLKNLGVPGVIMSPDMSGGGGAWEMSDEEAQETKDKFRATFGGDNRGEPMLMAGPTKLQAFGFSPQQLDLSNIRNVAEERVTAALGIPAAVVGFGTGLEQIKVGATLKIYLALAWQANLIPTKRLMAEEIQIQLVPDFENDLDAKEFAFDLSLVKVLQDDQNDLATVWANLTRAGIAKRGEARKKFGLMAGPDDDVYITQPGVQAEPKMPATDGNSNDQTPPALDSTPIEDGASGATGSAESASPQN